MDSVYKLDYRCATLLMLFDDRVSVLQGGEQKVATVGGTEVTISAICT
jgi:hypothetical protein